MNIYKIIKFNFSYSVIEEGNIIEKDLNTLQPYEREQILGYFEASKRAINKLSRQDLSDVIEVLEEYQKVHPFEKDDNNIYTKFSYKVVNRYRNHIEIEFNVQFTKDDLS